MTKGKGMRRKPKKIVRTPATRFAHLQKQIKRRPVRVTAKTKNA